MGNRMKVKTTPERCACGRIPVFVKGKGASYVVCCSAGSACQHQPTPHTQPTLDKAVEAWNEEVRKL